MVRPAGVTPAAVRGEDPRAPTDPCQACGGPLEPDQEWCLECGAARSALRAPPPWWIAVAIMAVVVVAFVVIVLVALP